MAEPTIAGRLEKKYIVLSTDQLMFNRVNAITPTDWTATAMASLEQLGDWHEVLLYRFLLLDLDEFEAFDPIDVIHVIRQQYQINIPVFCFGGDEDVQDEMRLARADRFFGRDEMLERLPEFLRQYDWG